MHLLKLKTLLFLALEKSTQAPKSCLERPSLASAFFEQASPGMSSLFEYLQTNKFCNSGFWASNPYALHMTKSLNEKGIVSRIFFLMNFSCREGPSFLKGYIHYVSEQHLSVLLLHYYMEN